MPNLNFHTLHAAAIGIQRACDKTGTPDLHLMPYSRFSAEDSSLWWLCTIKARTAFDQGKFVVGKPDRFGFESGIVCGLHVERGVKQTIGSADWKLGPGWMWHKFVDDMHGDVPGAVDRANGILGQPMKLFVFASVEGGAKPDRICFEATGAGLALQEADMGLGVLTDTPQCSTWPELSRNLELLPVGVDWHWVEVYLIEHFGLDPADDDDVGVCARMLECFQEWLGRA